MNSNRTSPLLRTLRYPGWMSNIVNAQQGGSGENFVSPRLPGKRGKCGTGGECLKLGLGCLPQQRTFWIECADYWTYSLCSCLDQRTFQGVWVPTTGLIPNDLPQLMTFQRGGVPYQYLP